MRGCTCLLQFLVRVKRHTSIPDPKVSSRALHCNKMINVSSSSECHSTVQTFGG